MPLMVWCSVDSGELVARAAGVVRKQMPQMFT